MEAQTSKSSLHPLMVMAGIAVILFSALGIAAIMGWIPASSSSAGYGLTASEPKPASAQQKPAPAAAAPARQPVARAQASPAPAQVAAKPQCADCGVIQAVREIEQKGQGTGLGAVGGAVVGGLVGSQIGGGRGQDVMTVVGAVGGGVAGHEVEKRVRSTKSYEVQVRLDDGSIRTIRSTTAPAWRPGDKVRIVNGVIQSNA